MKVLKTSGKRRRYHFALLLIIVASCSVPGRNYKELTGEPAVADSVEETFQQEDFNTEDYNLIRENQFLNTIDNPLSSFSIDVDGASYSNTRRFIEGGQLPPKDAVRIEEFLNYFKYNLKDPKKEDPIALTTEVSDCPWNPNNKLAFLGLQAKRISFENSPAANLVFLIDVSGSMADAEKLPLLKKSFLRLLKKLRARDNVSIVVYAGAAGVVLEPTSGNDKEKISEALDNLQSGGSTAGGEGITLAYAIARQQFIKGGINRIILATDGDFNVGTTTEGELVELVEKNRESGVYLTVLGFGMGNLKDSRMEALADNGNGNYYYIDSEAEAHKVLVEDIGSTLNVVAADVKLQLEFDPINVKSYRLIGYENRRLTKEEYKDNKQDAGDIGAGHSVIALYELVLNNEIEIFPGEMKYQELKVKKESSLENDLFTLRLRYKNPGDSISKELVDVVKNHITPLTQTSTEYRFSAAAVDHDVIQYQRIKRFVYNQESLFVLRSESCYKKLI